MTKLGDEKSRTSIRACEPEKDRVQESSFDSQLTRAMVDSGGESCRSSELIFAWSHDVRLYLNILRKYRRLVLDKFRRGVPEVIYK